jgi:hypothetical protein
MANEPNDESVRDSQEESEQQPADSDQPTAQSEEQPAEQTDESTEQSESGEGKTKTIQPPSYDVPLLQQPSDNTCWATVATMMMSWHDKTSYTIEAAMGRAGSQYQTMVKNDQGLLGRDKPAFLAAGGLQSEAPQDYTVEGMAELIQKYGPLWVTTDESPDQNFAIHARIVTSMSGDGTIDGTMLQINDPADGQQHSESFNIVMQKFDRVAFDDLGTHAPMRVQVVHF